MFEFLQRTIEEIIDSEREMVLAAAQRYGKYYDTALQCSVLFSRFVKEITRERWIHLSAQTPVLLSSTSSCSQRLMIRRWEAVLTGNCQSVVNATLDVQRYLPSSVYAANWKLRGYRFAFFSGFGQIFQGWASVQRGQGQAAVRRIREGLVAAEATGWRSHEPAFHGLLAEALALTGAIDEGLGILAEALTTAETSGARGADAELYRLRGELLQLSPSPEWTEVEGYFRRALAVAHEQGTRGFELRAAVSLARLLSERGRRTEAHDLLSPISGWFTEGFDTPDLKEARALLHELR